MVWQAAPSHLIEDDVDATIVAAFLFDFCNAQRTDLARAPDMRAAARLHIDPWDFQESQAGNIGWRPDRHGAHELRAIRKFFLCDPATKHWMIRRNQRVETVRQVILVQTILHIKIESAASGANTAAGYAIGDYSSEEVQPGVHAHVCVAPLPVQDKLDFFVDFKLIFISKDMQDFTIFAVHSVRYFENCSITAANAALVAGLAAAQRIENRAIKDRAAGGYTQHLHLAGPAIRVFVKQLTGRWQTHASIIGATAQPRHCPAAPASESVRRLRFPARKCCSQHCAGIVVSEEGSK